MKALTKTIAVATLLIVTASTIFVSCKKDNDETLTQNRQTEMKSEAQVIYEMVKKFESLRESYHSNSRSDNGIRMSTVIWKIGIWILFIIQLLLSIHKVKWH